MAVRLSLGHGAGEERVASCRAPQPSPDCAVHEHVFRGWSADSPRGDERACCAPGKSNAVLSTVRSRSRRLDAMAVRLSHGQRAGEERVASCPAPQPSPHCAVHAHVLRGRSAYSARGDAQGPHATEVECGITDGPKPQPPTGCVGRAAEPRLTKWGESRRELSRTTTKSASRGTRARAPRAVGRFSTGR